MNIIKSGSKVQQQKPKNESTEDIDLIDYIKDYEKEKIYQKNKKYNDEIESMFQNDFGICQNQNKSDADDENYSKDNIKQNEDSYYKFYENFEKDIEQRDEKKPVKKHNSNNNHSSIPILNIIQL